MIIFSLPYLYFSRNWRDRRWGRGEKGLNYFNIFECLEKQKQWG